MQDQTEGQKKEKGCRVCDQEFESDRELNEHQRESHPTESSAENSAFSESHGADGDDIRKTA
jgi:hypothetical protein